MSYVRTEPNRRKPLVPVSLPVVCPVCDKGIVAQGLRAHLGMPSERGGHAFNDAKAVLYTARAVQLAAVSMREMLNPRVR